MTRHETFALREEVVDDRCRLVAVHGVLDLNNAPQLKTMLLLARLDGRSPD